MIWLRLPRRWTCTLYDTWDMNLTDIVHSIGLLASIQLIRLLIIVVTRVLVPAEDDSVVELVLALPQARAHRLFNILYAFQHDLFVLNI